MVPPSARRSVQQPAQFSDLANSRSGAAVEEDANENEAASDPQAESEGSQPKDYRMKARGFFLQFHGSPIGKGIFDCIPRPRR